jgi:hypothetical protein
MLLIWVTNNTLNIQSFMGCIMAVGVAVAVILLISNAELPVQNKARAKP